ncbi:MAG: twin-arginine translocase subunit TatC [Chitinophagales bacterium]|nr:twin-arginine translocase subunit TatC [Chitinophagales bacterium]MCZ2392919.1 twin-arginine translocase subunit TatC [Chitinophagales bacterium]
MKENILDDASENGMSFLDHLEELRWHIIRSVIVIFIFTVVAFLNKRIIFDYILFGPTRPDFPTNIFFCWISERVPFLNMCSANLEYHFINTDLAGQFMMHIKMSFIVGFVVAFPFVFWEFWRFIKPALYKNEVQSTKGIVFFSSVLFVLGCCFGYFIIAPFSINFFYSYSAIEIAQNFISIDNYIANVISMVIPTGIMFELPMFVYFLSKIGMIGPELLTKSRRFAFVIILFVIAIITPQGDMISLVLISSPVLILYEVSILISKRVSRKFAEDFD